MSHREPATLPPDGLVGLDPAWSRLVTTSDVDGVDRTWHVLDNWTSDEVPRRTLLCVHGNPSWSYLFRQLLLDAPDDMRVVAVDHLDMGYSERTGTTRRLATRVDDLGRVSDALGVHGPTVTVAHDWGGPISLGWAQRHRDQLIGVVLMNTAVHQPAGSPAPSVIRLVRSRPMLHAVTTATTAFIRGAFEMSDERPGPAIRSGFLAPYGTSERRRAIGEFVADIPLEPEHPSAATLDSIAAGLDDFDDVPVLLLWGAADRVFSDLYLHDLEARLPHADVHRHPSAGHFVSEDTDCLGTALTWIDALDGTPTRAAGHAAGPSTLLDIPAPSEPRLAIAEMTGDGDAVDTDAFAALVAATASGLVRHGIAPGDRVAVMIPPGIELGVTLLACWHAGAVVVLVDAGLGPRGMSAAMKAADPDHLIGVPRALAAARALRWPGRRIAATAVNTATRLGLGADADLPSLRTAGSTEMPPPAAAGDLAAIAFTSGATGPSKGVRYTHGALAAQRDAIAELYDITTDDRLVAAFAPFALYGPLLGIPSVVPDMDVTAPGTLTAASLGDAVCRVDATLVFASPAALANVARTADELTDEHRAAFERVRLLLSAGAPVRPELLRAAAALFPNATACTPYGMTECLPVANISLHELDTIEASTEITGVCVGTPLASVEAMIRPLGAAPEELTSDPGTVGEIVVRAPHQRLGYDRLWGIEHAAGRPPGWHATGDVGHLDGDGRLWVGGRIGHVISTSAGPVTPVGVEQRVESLSEVDLAAAVGVGPAGSQQVVVIVQGDTPVRSARLADLDLHDRVRAVLSQPVAAVLEVAALPVDRRHNSKIDRTRLAAWAEEILAGGRIANP